MVVRFSEGSSASRMTAPSACLGNRCTKLSGRAGSRGWQNGTDGRISAGTPRGHQEQPKDLFGSHRGDSDDLQARLCGQGSTSQETVHHAGIGCRAWCHSWLSSL